MNKIAVFACLLFSLFVEVNAVAAPRTRQQALQIAKDKASSLGVEFTTSTQPRRASAQSAASDDAAFYVFNNGNDNGWTIVAGDDRTEEIIGYSDSGSLDEDNLPAPVQEMLNYYASYIESLGDAPVSDAVSTPRKAAATGTAAMGPYLTTRWDQYAPYNILTPTQSGSHTATCCVVTATAQILYYLYHTIGGQSSSTFSSSIDSYSLSASGSYVAGSAVSGPRTYNWDKMLPDYAEGYTDEQATAIATLMRDLGTAVKVNYNTSVSITNSKYVANNAAALFGLQSGSSYTYNASMGASTWKNAVVTELGNYRPVLVASTAHAYVCDGYDGNGLYHFNFGYSGRGDGWYTFDAMNGYGQATWGYTTGLKLRASDTNVTKLDDICKTARAQAALTPVGTQGGNYRQDLYNALMTLVTKGETAVANNCSSMTDTEVTDLCTQISQAIIELTMKRTPYAKGTYYVKTYYNYSDGNTKAMYASGTGVNWGTINTSSDNYKWYLEYDESTNAYKMYNVGTNGHFTSISTSTQAKLSTSSTTEVEIRPLARVTRNNKQVYACTIRPMVSGYNTGFNYYCHQGSHSNGSGTGSTVVGWEPYSDFNQWYLEPIDVEETVKLTFPTSSFAQESLTLNIGDSGTNQLTTNSNGTIQYTSSNTSVATVSTTGLVTAVGAGTATISATIAQTETYSSQTLTYVVTVKENSELLDRLDALIKEAEGLYTADELAAAQQTGSLITSTSQFSSPYTESSEGSFSYLLDGSSSTFWHSAWSDGNNNSVSVTPGTHYFVVTLNEAVQGELMMQLIRRDIASDQVQTFQVSGSNDNSNWTDITTLDLSSDISSGSTVTANFTLGSSYKYLKFTCTATNSGRGYFHMGDFQLYKIASEKEQALIDFYAELTTAKNTSPATQDAIDALEAAINAYKAFLYVKGDVNLDGNVDIRDVAMLISILKGETVPNHGETDIDGNTKSDADDVKALVDIILKQE